MEKMLLLEDDLSLIDGLQYTLMLYGFELEIARGGDDYMTKPFKLGELCSRIRALLRRAVIQKPSKSSL